MMAKKEEIRIIVQMVRVRIFVRFSKADSVIGSIGIGVNILGDPSDISSDTGSVCE
jgi:hypothetical protein